MNQETWLRFLDKLSPRLRDALQVCMQRVDFIIMGYANRHHDEIQKLTRKVALLERRIDDLTQERERVVGE